MSLRYLPIALLGVLACEGGGASNDAGACGTPGVSYACGAARCTDAQPLCCRYTNLPDRCVARGSGGECQTAGGAPVGHTTQCDDANDCGGAGHGCYRSFSKGTGQTDYLCDAPGREQICKLSCECLGGKACTAGTCQ
jgi:hypothetical protein